MVILLADYAALFCQSGQALFCLGLLPISFGFIIRSMDLSGTTPGWCQENLEVLKPYTSLKVSHLKAALQSLDKEATYQLIRRYYRFRVLIRFFFWLGLIPLVTGIALVYFSKLAQVLLGSSNILPLYLQNSTFQIFH